MFIGNTSKLDMINCTGTDKVTVTTLAIPSQLAAPHTTNMLCWSRVLLLLYVLLLAAATEDSEEQQKENEGFASMKYGKGRGQPGNVTVEAVSGAALNVSWGPPDEKPQYYEVTDVTDGSYNDTNNTFLIIGGLQPCTKYNYIVNSVYDTEWHPSPPTSGTTLASVPPPPLNCDFDHITTNSMYLTWSAPDTACYISNYSISWSWSSLWEDDHDSGETLSTVTHTSLRGLPPYANVTVNIAAATDAGFGPPLTCWNVTQQDGDAPQDVTVTAVSESALRVSWDPPSEDPDHYSITVGTEPGVPVYNTSYILEGLESCTEYEIAVASEYGNEEYMAESVLGKTLASVPPPPLNCDFDHITTNSMNLTWSAPDTGCDISNYSISWSWSSLWEDNHGSGETHSTVTHTSLWDLPPYANVTVNIAAATDAGFGPPLTCWSVTQEDTPGPPELLNLHNDKTSLIVKWTEPEEKNGVIDEYRITWTDSNDTSTNATIPEESCCSHTINNLTQCENYTVSVSAHTVVDWGEESPTDEAFISNFVTDSSLNCDGSNSREAHISWSLAVHDCPVDEYFMNWITTVQWNGHQNSNSTTMKGEGNLTMVLRGLEPQTEFDFCLSVDEAGRNKACCTSTTRPEKPSQPKNLKIENKTQTTVTLNWSLPDQLNGILEGWQLTWSPNTEDEGIVLAISKRAYTVTNLKPSTNYTFDLMAGNGAGYGDAAEIIVTTKPPDNNNNTNNTAIIIGASVGGVLLVVILVASSVYVYRNKSRKTPPISRKDTLLERSQNIYSQYPDPYVNEQQTPGNKESLSHEQGPREDIALDEINIKRPNSSMFTEEITPARNNAVERRPSQTPRGVINDSGLRRISESYDIRPGGQNEMAQRRASETPEGLKGQYNNAQRRSTMFEGRPVGQGYNAQRRASMFEGRPVGQGYNAQRRASMFEGRPVGQGYNAQRRASMFEGRPVGQGYNAQRRASMFEGRPVGKKYKVQRRASDIVETRSGGQK